LICGRRGERGRFAVLLTGRQAAVQATEQPAVQVPQRRGVPVTGFSAAVVVVARLGRAGEGGEGPVMTCDLETLVADLPMGDLAASTAGPGQWGRSRVRAQSPRGAESFGVIADLGEQPGADYWPDAGETAVDPGVRVAGERGVIRVVRSACPLSVFGGGLNLGLD
jgi:hypothetical protein